MKIMSATKKRLPKECRRPWRSGRSTDAKLTLEADCAAMVTDR